MANKRRKIGSRRTAKTMGLEGDSFEPTAEQVDTYRRWCGGESQVEIAKTLKCPQSQVSRVCSKVEKWMVARTIDDIRGLKLRQTVRLEKYVAELEGAWKRSQENAETKTVEEIALDAKAAGASVPALRTKTQTVGQSGNAAYLEAAMGAMDRIRKIWGADAPLQVQHFGEPRVAGMDRGEAAILFLERKLEEQRELQRKHLDPQPN